MPEAWTGNLIGKMHNKGITYDDLAAEMGVGKAYISMILNGKRKPPEIRKRMETALEMAIRRKSGVTVDALLADDAKTSSQDAG